LRIAPFVPEIAFAIFVPLLVGDAVNEAFELSEDSLWAEFPGCEDREPFAHVMEESHGRASVGGHTGSVFFANSVSADESQQVEIVLFAVGMLTGEERSGRRSVGHLEFPFGVVGGSIDARTN
jgi:hypothetical protein